MEVGEVIQFYESDKRFPAWGFGGRTYYGSGLHPTVPKNTPRKLAELLETCWQQDPASRPDFSEIIVILQQIKKEYVLAEKEKHHEEHHHLHHHEHHHPHHHEHHHPKHAHPPK